MIGREQLCCHAARHGLQLGRVSLIEQKEPARLDRNVATCPLRMHQHAGKCGGRDDLPHFDLTELCEYLRSMHRLPIQRLTDPPQSDDMYDEIYERRNRRFMLRPCFQWFLTRTI